MKILIVDDSKAMRMIVRRALRQAGFGAHTVDEACNGAEALVHIRLQRPDLILCDWNMPEMRGIDVLRSLRREGVDTPFGFVTSEASHEMRQLAFAEGAAFLIVKPFQSDVFERALSPFLG